MEKKKGQRGGKLNTCSVVLRKGGDVKWFETMMEASFFLECSVSAVSKAVKNKTTIKGWWVEKDEPQTKL